MKWLSLLIFSLFFCLAAFLWRQHNYAFHAPEAVNEGAVSASLTDEPIMPVAFSIALDEKKVALGEQLFNDPRLSRNNSVSCASCHALEKGGTDRQSLSSGIEGNTGLVNAPTVFNSTYNFKQFWDGRAETLEEQVEGPTHNPLEMDSNWTEIINKLQMSPDYVQSFNALYADSIQSHNIP
jgi:cytochrome c peroxidase